MSSGKHNLNIEQGASFSVQFTWKDGEHNPIDLTDYSAKLQIRASKEATAIIHEADDSDGLVLGGEAGTILFTIPTADTTDFTFDNAVYDLELTLNGETTRLIEGRVFLSKEVTK